MVNLSKIISAVLILHILSFSSAETGQSNNILLSLQNRIEKALPGIKNELFFQFLNQHKTLVVKYKTRKFMMHFSNMTGEFSPDACETEGPSYRGFLLEISLQKAGTVNQAIVPQTLQRPYWKTFLNITPIKNSDKQVYWGLSFGSRTDNQLIKQIQKVFEEIVAN